ncbi:dihydroorotate dehydrogenase electron transfer subunit [bacterium]|nr:dihydroorotate dehydrogenase electron transfer subunit [bacterium]
MIHICEITEQHSITNNIYRMRLKAPMIASSAKPGQFIHIKVRTGIDPLLRRPFSIHRIDPGNEEIILLYRKAGRGTSILSQMSPGDSLDLMGPLGQGFDLQTSFDHAIIVAGGMGSAPVFFLIDELLKAKKKITLLWGVRAGEEIFNENEIRKQGIELKVATEDASKGHCGFVTDLLSEYLSKNITKNTYSGFVCGPECMIHEVQKIVESVDFRWQASLEARMACGVGVCLGCAVLIRERGFQMVCKDGPVFDLREVQFNG